MALDKKAEGTTEFWAGGILLPLIIFVIILGATAGFFAYLTSTSQAEVSQLPQDSRLAVLSDRLLSSPSCLAPDDRSARAAVALEKFNREQMDTCFLHITDADPALRIRLAGLGQEFASLQTDNWVEGQSLDRRLPSRQVTVQTQSGIETATLLVEVQDARR